MGNEEIIKDRKERIIKWIRNPYNLGLIAILVFAIALRIYYFVLTKNQPLWWDEAEYMSAAKHWALNIPYDLNPQRPPLFQFLAATLLTLGLGESSIKFLLVLLPSIFLVWVTYLLGKEMFSKKVGLFAALAMSCMWSFLFWTERFQPDFFSMCFQMLSFLFFWKLLKKPDNKTAIYVGIFIALGFYFKISALIVPLTIGLFILFKDGISFIRKKEYWIILASFLITMLPFFIWQFILFGNPIAFAPSYTHGMTEERPLGWMTLGFFLSFPKLLFFLLFLVGVGMLIYKLLLTGDIVLKDSEKRFDPQIFSFLILLVTSLFYIIYIQGVIEDRWIFLIAPFIFYFSAIGFFWIKDNIDTFSKILGVIVLILVLGSFIYFQIQHSTQLIDMKKDSYSQIKDAAIWMKDNSEKGEVILSVSYTQTIAYSDRTVYTYSRMSEYNFTKLIMEKRPKYLMASIIEPNHPEWLITQAQYPDSSWAMILPYFNSSVKIAGNQIVSVDLKQVINKGDLTFTLVYPSQIDGVFIYKIDYK